MAQKKLSPCPECGGKAKLDRKIHLKYRGAPAKGSEGRYAMVRCLSPGCWFATEKLRPKNGERNEDLYARAVSEWEQLCEDKNKGGLTERYKRAIFRRARKRRKKLEETTRS